MRSRVEVSVCKLGDGRRVAECPNCGDDIVRRNRAGVERAMREHGQNRGHQWRSVRFLAGPDRD